jgi:hypothetical protein
MTNGVPCAETRYAEPVPATFDDPVAAVAWQYDAPVETSRRRT